MMQVAVPPAVPPAEPAVPLDVKVRRKLFRPLPKGAEPCLWALVLALVVGTAGAGCRRTPPAARDDTSAERIVHVAGSSDAYLLARALASQFEKKSPGHRIIFAPAADNGHAVDAVLRDDADIGVIARPLSQDERRSSLTYLHVAHDLVAFATHPGLGVASLTRQQLLDIYAGDVVNWKQVGGPDAPIVVFHRPAGDALELVLRDRFFGPGFHVTDRAVVVDRPEETISEVAATQYSIGFVSLGNAIMSGETVALLAIDGAKPTLADFRKGRYPLSRPFGLVIGPSPSRAAMHFVKFIYGTDARRVIEGHGFAPVTMDLVIGIPPERDLLLQERRYRSLVDYLGRHMGMQITVELKLFPSYGDVLEELREGRVNAAFLGGLSLAVAKREMSMEPIAVVQRNGTSTARGLLVTRKDRNIHSWKDLKGKTLGLVDRESATGYLYPLLYFRERGVEQLDHFVGKIVFTGSHDLAFTKVASGELDAAAGKDSVLRDISRVKPEIASALRVLASSPPLPGETFVLARDLRFPCFDCHDLGTAADTVDMPQRPDELDELLRELLLGLHDDSDGARVLDALGADRFTPPTSEPLREVEKMIERAEFPSSEVFSPSP